MAASAIFILLVNGRDLFLIGRKFLFMARTAVAILLALSLARLLLAGANETPYLYIRIGQKNDSKTTPTPGIAMMGGGSDLDEAFRWLCKKANGGDFLILRARGSDDYNPHVNRLCKLNSVATLIIPDRTAAQDVRVTEIIGQAEAVFIAGGDQARYINFWKGTPVQAAINAAVAKGVPIGGTSAGLAVQGEFVYGALSDKPDDSDLASGQVLFDPFFERVTVVRDFLRIPYLQNSITDSHFVTRDRMGRSLGFLARIIQDGWSKNPREIAVDEKSAVLVEADGRGTVVGSGRGAYFMRPTRYPEVCLKGRPLTFREVSVYKVPRGAQFNLVSGTGVGGMSYSLSVEEGVIRSTQANQSIY